MRIELKHIIKKLDLIEPVRLSDKDAEELRKQYPDGKYPDNIKEVTNQFAEDDCFFIFYTDVDEFSNEEISLLIQLKSYEKVSKIHGYLLFFVILTIISLIVGFLGFLVAVL